MAMWPSRGWVATAILIGVLLVALPTDPTFDRRTALQVIAAELMRGACGLSLVACAVRD
jgi:hypothetical protein